MHHHHHYVRLDADAATWSPEEEVSASTVAATAAVTGQHMLKVKGYSLLQKTHGENGRYIESSTFKVGGHRWRIRCYPNGDGEYAGFVSLYLCLCSNDHRPDAAVHAECEFALVRRHRRLGTASGGHRLQSGEPPSTTSSYSVRSDAICAFGGKDNTTGACAWGDPEFVGVEELERSGFIEDDCFAVRCTVTVVRVRTVKGKPVLLLPHDMMRLGRMTTCDGDGDGDVCKRHHRRHARRPAETLLERFAKFFCYS